MSEVNTDVGVHQINKRSLLAGRYAVVTGASGGVGRAVAPALSHHGVKLCVVGRNPAALADTVAAIRPFSNVTSFQIDLTVEESLPPLVRHVEEVGGLDILIHSAGVIYQAPMERARIEDFDRQYHANIRVPYLLTQRLLPLLESAQGQIVFMNSSVGLGVRRPEVGQYGATKHALRAIADSLREEANSSVYLGRTATPMQEALHKQDVQALMLSPTAEVTDILHPPHDESLTTLAQE